MKYQGILGAALGDVAGSIYEFDGKHKPTRLDAPLVLQKGRNRFTDDTVLTAAVADCLQHGQAEQMAVYLKSWAKKYPHAGYGGRFSAWVDGPSMEGYGSFGNGSAMRVSSVAYFAASLEEAKRLARLSALPTHDHPEGVKGAETLASMIYMALHGSSKEELHAYALTQYPECEQLSFAEMAAYTGIGPVICQVTLPQALYAFFHTDSFLSCLRMCLCIGWDADTLSAIACSLAEAYYQDIPSELVEKVRAFLPEDIASALRSVPAPWNDKA